MYIEFEKEGGDLEIFLRHIQMELRYKDYNNAKILYETILTTFTANLEIVSFIVLEYAEFSLKYFRDIEFSKGLLKTYFSAYPFS